MATRVHGNRSGRLQTSLWKIALGVVLLSAFASVSRTWAHDDIEERTKNDRNERRDGQANEHDWPMIGHDPANTRNQPFERRITPRNVGRLWPKWVSTTAGDVSATPAVVNGAVYFGDFGGMIWKLDAKTGTEIWSHRVPDYTGNAGDYARTSPLLAGNTLVVGIIKGSPTVPGPNMLGIDASTGALRWTSQIHPDPHAAMTGSPLLVGNTVITGISANSASAPATAVFRGAIVALNAQTGAIRWRTY